MCLLKLTVLNFTKLTDVNFKKKLTFNEHEFNAAQKHFAGSSKKLTVAKTNAYDEIAPPVTLGEVEGVLRC